MIRCLFSCALTIIAVGCNEGRSPIPATELAHSHQSQATEDEPTLSDNQRYDNPVDKKTYIAPGGWKEYQPSAPRKAEENARIRSVGVRLLTAQGEIAERTSVDSMVAFFKRAETSAKTALAEVTEKATVVAQFSCSPGKHDVQLAHQGNVTQDQLQSYYDALLAMETMPVKGEVSFQLTIQVDPVQPE